MAHESRISQYEHEAREQLQHVPQWATEMVQEQPAVALGSVFAVGFLVGASVCTMLLAPAPTPQRRAWQSAHDFGSRAHDFGSRMMDQLGHAVPKQVSSFFGH